MKKTLWNDLLLGITRLTDPVKSVGKRNITLQSLANHIHYPELKVEIEKDVAVLKEKSSFCRDWRNRSIAHFDYDLTINQQTAKPLESANREKFQETITGIHTIIKKVYLHYLKSAVMFDFIDSFQGAQILLAHLENGLRFKELKREGKLSGTWSDDGFESLV